MSAFFVKMKKEMQTFFTHCNGRRPYKVNVYKNKRVDVFRKLDDKSEDDSEDAYDSKPIESWKSVQRVFIGKSPLTKNRFDGNTILLKIGRQEYFYIGHDRFSFFAEYPIHMYVSEIRGDDLPFAYGVDEKGAYYFMNDKEVFSYKQEGYMDEPEVLEQPAAVVKEMWIQANKEAQRLIPLVLNMLPKHEDSPTERQIMKAIHAHLGITSFKTKSVVENHKNNENELFRNLRCLLI